MIEYEIFYGPHGSAKDLEDLKARFQEADIFIPECFAWLPSNLVYYNSISEGVSLPPKLSQKDAASEYLLEMVSRSYKPVALIDLPDSHPLTARIEKFQSGEIRYGRRFSETLQYAADYLRQDVAMDMEREDYEVAQLDPAIDAILKFNKTLAIKDPIRVLLFQGSYHRRVGKLMIEAGMAVKETFAYEPIIYPFQYEVKQKISLGEDIDEELMARAVIEMYVLSLYLFKISQDTRAVDEYCKKALSRFNLAEIEYSFQEAKVGSYNVMTALMRDKGVPFPPSRQDIYAFSRT